MAIEGPWLALGGAFSLLYTNTLRMCFSQLVRAIFQATKSCSHLIKKMFLEDQLLFVCFFEHIQLILET